MRNYKMRCLFSLVLLLMAGYTYAESFAYAGEHGPAYWGGSCEGKYQSPINIEEHAVETITFPPLQLSGADIARPTYIKNNGHTVKLRTNESDSFISVSGGPLGNSTYLFDQLHFHWGENDNEGSEYKINNRSFAMELHALFYNSEYESVDHAMEYKDGLTVLAYFFEAGEEVNPTYDLIVKSLPNVVSSGKKDPFEEPVALQSLFVPYPEFVEHYFTYNGSLTTPPCSEVVTWIDFKYPLELSRKQIAAFRELQGREGEKVTHNVRPIQPLSDRIVYLNVPEMYDEYSEHNISERNHYDVINRERSVDNSAESGTRASGLMIVIACFFVLR